MRKDGRRCEAPLTKKGIWGLGLVLSSHDRKEGNCKRMNGAVKGKSCSVKGSLLLLLILAEKKSNGRGLEQENMCIEKSLHYEGI